RCQSSSIIYVHYVFFFFSSRRRHTRSKRDWSSDVCSSDFSQYSRNVLMPYPQVIATRLNTFVTFPCLYTLYSFGSFVFRLDNFYHFSIFQKPKLHSVSSNSFAFTDFPYVTSCNIEAIRTISNRSEGFFCI